jgi:hypothetical protein
MPDVGNYAALDQQGNGAIRARRGSFEPAQKPGMVT